MRNVLALAGLALIGSTGCESTDPAASVDASNDSAAEASAADAPADSATADGPANDAGTDAGCATVYDLASFVGDAGGLCAAADATMCSCTELTQGEQVACHPSGAGCVKLPALCDVCGWVNCTDPVPAATECAQYDGVLPGVRAGDTTAACASDSDCGTGKACTNRIGDRMFCSEV